MADAPLSSILNWANVGAAMPESYGANSPILDPVAKAALGAGRTAYSGFTAPGDALAGKIAPEDIPSRAMDMASMVTLGAGAVPAEANSLRAGLRPYRNVPDALMGYRKSGAQKGFAETNYPHTQDVQVVFPDGEVMSDQIKGMNPDHALERAYRNWQDAIHIFAPNKT